MQHMVSKLVCLVAVAGLSFGALSAQLNGDDFKFKMEIAPTAGKVTSTLANFPVLVRLSAARQPGFVPSRCGTDGSELRFALEDGTLLAHEIDTWTADGDCCVWVNIPSLTAETKFYAYWGLLSGKTAPAVNPADAWPGFIGVWHLSEQSGEVLDSSKNGYDATNGAAVASSDVAIVGRSRNVQGSKFMTGVLKLADPNAARPLSNVAKLTVSGWMYDSTSTETGYRSLMGKGAWKADGWCVNTQNNRTTLTAVGYNDSTRLWNFPNGKTLAGQWHHLTVSYNSGKVQFWIDGAKVETNWANLNAPNESSTHELTFAGGLTGYVDEMRLMDGETSDARVAADYATQNTGDFLTYGNIDGASFRIAAIPLQHYDGTYACEPEVTVIDKVTGNTLDPKDFTVVYSGNAARGTATVTVTANAGTAYAGDKSVQTFRVALVCRVTDFALAEEGDGRSWDSPMSLTNAIAAAQDNDLLLLKAGRYVAAKQIVIAKPLVIRGGLKGTDDTTLDPDDPMTYFDARDNSAFQSMVSVTTATGAGTENVFERICFTRGYVRGLNKTGAADITFRNCRFYQNGGTYNPNGGFSGVGANLTGTSAVEARFEDCIFDYNARTNYPGNRNTCMQGAGFYATGFKRVYVDNCLFATNCGIMGITHEYGQDRGDGGGAIYANAQPLTVRNTRFIANNTPGRDARGGTVRIIGASGGTAFSNCTFVANCTKYSSGYTSLGAPISISSANTSDFYDIEGCTFAYNVTASSTSSAGLTVDKGTAKVRNSIFYGNRAVGITAHYGREISVYSNGKLDIDYSLLTGSDDSYISSSTAANLTVGDHMVYGDPLFGTTLAQANALKSGDYYNVKKYAELMAIDIHENALGEGYSRAVDTGTGDFTNEPAPNGGVRNLGAYGNTTEAAVSSALGTPALTADGIAVEFGADTKPTVTVTPGGDVNYNAHVLIEIADTDPDGGSFAGWTERAVFSAVQTGESVTLSGSDLHQPGDSLYVRVTVEYPGMAAPLVVAKTATVTGDLPFYYGHGGGPGVIHVREGAAGKKDGSDWTEAFDSIDAALALAAADATKTNIWVAGTIVTDIAPGSRSPAAAELTIRGGFHGDEDTLADRASGTYATLNGKAGAYDMVSLNNAHPVIIERIVFERAAAHGLYKKGSGTLDLVDCKFHLNSLPSASSTGRGLCLEGGTRVSVTNCVFLGNYMSGGGSSSSRGGGISATGVGRLYLDDSLFVTNGCNPACGIGSGMSGRDTCGGGLLLLSGVPVTARNCRFTANRTPIRGEGGAIWIGGAGSAFTNCVFTGNQSTYAEGNMSSAGGSASGGAIVVSLGSAAGTVDFEHCTLAYNLGDALHVPGGLDVVKGTVRMHNSIIYSNTRGKLSDVGSDIAVKADGRLTLSYCRLTEEEGTTGRPTARTVTEASEGLITYDHVTFGDPGFATSVEDYEKLLKYSGDYTYFDSSAAGIRNTTLLDVHLCSPAGMRLNDGTWKTDEIRLSDAIDKGDPDSPFVNEPQPNGDRANLGAYGNTKDASCSAKAQPEIGEVAVSFPNGFARPLVTVPMTGNGVYFADVTIYVGSSAEYSTTYRASGVLNGAVLEVFARRCFPVGSTIYWRVDASAEGADARVKTGSAVVPDDAVFPAWDGTGGDPEKVVHVWPEAVGGNRDGYSWWDGYATIADALAQVTAERNEIWVIGGTNSELTAALAGWSKNFPVAIRGGFAATDCSPEARQPGARTVVDGSNTVATVASVSNAEPLTVDGFDFVNGKSRGFNKSGDGAITLLNCGFRNNGATVTATSGRGAYLSGSTASSAVVANCVFEGNVQNAGGQNEAGYGLGLYIEKFAALTLDDTLFLTNGAAPTASTSSSSAGRDGFYGSAIYSSGVPVFARRCQFRGNRATLRSDSNRGGCVRLDGACGGSVFEHCIWAGNHENTGWNQTSSAESAYAGALVVNLSNAGDAVTVRNSTFAYNIAGTLKGAAGISVAKGTLNLSDSILFGNRVPSDSLYGADLALPTVDGHANVTYTLFTTNADVSVSAALAANLDRGAGVTYGDPLFVTAYTNATAHVASWSYDAMRFKAAEIADIVAFDVHLKSPEGYVTNGAPMTWLKAEKGVISPAIDAGDPNADYVRELTPNGLRLNMGVYGNTPEASKTVTSEIPLGFTDVEVVYEDGYSRPSVSFTVTGDPGCIVGVTAIVTVDGGNPFELPLPGCAAGGTYSIRLPEYYAKGTQIVVSLTGLSSAGPVTSKPVDFEVDRERPVWYGHGGGAGVIHVREGATGNKDGSNWLDAFDTIDAALALAQTDETKTNVWVAGTLVSRLSVNAHSVKAAKLEIRGGFTGLEDTPEARTLPHSTLFGNNAFDMVSINNAAGHDVVFERMKFVKAPNNAVYKSGAGDMLFTECQFLTNGYNVGEGGGIKVTSASGATVSVRNCVFDHNEKNSNHQGTLRGAAICASTLKRLVIDDSLFVDNGAGWAYGPGTPVRGHDTPDGAAIYVSGAPVTMRNSIVRGSKGGIRSEAGGIVRLTGACGGSAFTNCVFAGNQNVYAEGDRASHTGKVGGAIVITLGSTAQTVDFEHCTIAYNLGDANNVPGGLDIVTGTVRLHNSIVFSNWCGMEGHCDVASDVAVWENGRLDVSHSLLTSLHDTNTVFEAAKGLVTWGEGLASGDPLFVTAWADATNRVSRRSDGYTHLDNDKFGFFSTVNVHLRGGSGYVDEATGEKVKAYRRGADSPALDTGDPKGDYSSEPYPNGHRVNMGAYGNTPWATMSKGGTLIFVR